MTVFKKSFAFGPHTVTIETGALARQANGSVLVTMGDTVVLVTACAEAQPRPGRDFFPLTVNYQEKTYAAGRIPGGFFRREGRPTERETLTSRLIDRPIRPLFPESFLNDVQVVATVLSLDPEIHADVPSMLGASAALCLSGVPFKGPIGGARVGYRNGQYELNPSRTDLGSSQLDLVVAGTAHAVLMVESEAAGLSEEIMLGAVVFGHEQMQVAIRAINELTAEAGKPRRPTPPDSRDPRSSRRSAPRRWRRWAMRTWSPRSSSATRASRKSRPRLPPRCAPVRRRRSPRTRWAMSSSDSRARSCAIAFSTASRASTGATSRRCGRSRSAWAFCRARTDRRCSRAVRPRRW